MSKLMRKLKKKVGDMMKFEERVLKHEFQLNDTDDEIIAYIRKNRYHIHKLSIQKVASDLYTVPNSVMRLAKKLGYNGFSELKVLIQQEDNSEEQISKAKIPTNVIKTIELINYDNLYEASKKMKTCKTIHFLGVGDSLSYCEMMVRHMRCIDKHAEYYQSYHDIDFQSRHCDKNDLLFIISASGENQRLIDVAKDAKERGVATISVTHFNKNGLSQVVDIPLYFYGEPRKVNGYNVNDRTGLMILLRELSEVFWRTYCV